MIWSEQIPSMDINGHLIPTSVYGTATPRSDPKEVPWVSGEGSPGQPVVRRDTLSANCRNSDTQFVTENPVSMEIS